MNTPDNDDEDRQAYLVHIDHAVDITFPTKQVCELADAPKFKGMSRGALAFARAVWR